jgi:aminoglycoside phosphotransferase (APT) family kinase protein
VESAAKRVRASPRNGWLAAVIPARARRFRVLDPELAATFACTSADLVEESADVEIARSEDLRGEAPFAIIALATREPKARVRLLRGVQRLARSAAIRRRIRHVRRSLRKGGYTSIEVLTWERGVCLRSSRSPSGAPERLAHRLPLKAVIVGARDPDVPTAFDEAVAAAESSIGRRLVPESLLVASSGVIVARADDVVLRVAIGPAASRIEEQGAALERLRTEHPGHVVADRVPWTVAEGRAGVAVWSAEQRLPGKPAPPLLTEALAEDCLDFLVALHEMGRNGDTSIAADADIVASLCDVQRAQAVRALGRELDKSLADLPRGFNHGDFWHGNLLVEGGRLTGVVDWPAARPGGLPLLDLMHLWTNGARELSGRELGSIVGDELLPLARAGGDELLHAYCRRIGVELAPGQLVSLVAAYWLNAVARELLDPDRDPDHATEPYWREANVENVLGHFSDRSRA